jgi:hypothetical protein
MHRRFLDGVYIDRDRSNGRGQIAFFGQWVGFVSFLDTIGDVPIMLLRALQWGILLLILRIFVVINEALT